MAFKIANRTRETVSTTGAIVAGTTDLILTGVTSTDLTPFSTSVGTGNSTVACVISGNGIDWLEFVGTVLGGSPDQISVDTIIASSAGGTSGISLATGSRCFGIIPADFQTLFDELFGNTVGDVLKRGSGGWAADVDAGITQLTGDVTAGPGNGSQAATIASNAVTNTKAAQMAAHTFKGNNTGVTATPLDLTATQLTAELNVMVGDSGSGGTKGLVPTPAAGDAAAGKFLGAGGSWAVPSTGTTLAGLSDVSITSLSANQNLRYDGTHWVNESDGYFNALTCENENSANGTTGELNNYASTQSPTTSFANWAARSARGTKASPAAVQTGDYLGEFSFWGYDGTDFKFGATVQARASENWSSGAHGTELRFSVTQNGTTTAVFPLILTNDGSLQLGGNPTLTQANAPYVFAFSAPQTSAYSNSQVIGHHKMAGAAQIPANFGAYLGLTSEAGGTSNATGSTVFSVEKAVAATPNTFTQIGTITFAASGVTATFATASGAAQTLAQGDVIRIVAPSTADATFAGFYATIVAARQ